MGGVRRKVHSSVRSRRKRSHGPSPITFFFWTFFLVSAAISYLWIYNQTDMAVKSLIEKKEQILEMENINRELQVTIDQLSQIDRITGIARLRLEMVIPPAESLIVYLSEPD
ncbi:MAG: cell division protein FtsL [Fidelibacterota bacterium]|nr:MAG: cell division protein FtsL [Candidatus Neomarinimicrobiota bacterium]